MKILISSCIRQHPLILKQFLESLSLLDKPDDCEYLFIVSNLDEKAQNLLSIWMKNKTVTIIDEEVNTPYVRDDETHHWTSEHVSNIILFKNRILEKGKEYDYLMYLDSDIYLHPDTLNQLLGRKKDIITEICWTQWYSDDPRILPNAWFYQKYGFPPNGLTRLRNEPLLKVGGFGGFYLLSKHALNSGVSFSRIEGKPDDWGEDRHFAVRAQRLGFDLWCDTTLPRFHIYRMKDLSRLEQWKQNGYRDLPHLKVLVTVPHTGMLRAELASYLLRLVAKYASSDKIRLSVDLSWGMPVDSSRNTIFQKWLATDNDWLLTIDSDIEPPPNVLEELLSHNKKVVGAVCWSSMGGEKGGRWEQYGIPYPVVMKKDVKGGWSVNRKAFMTGQRLVSVDAVSTACLLIHREVAEKIGKNWFRLRYDDVGVCVAGEDFTFFDHVLEKGCKIYVDTALQCEHYKTVGIKRFNDLLAETESKVNA